MKLGFLLVCTLAIAACGEEERAVKRPAVTRAPTSAPPAQVSGERLSDKEAFILGVAQTSVNVHCRGGNLTEARVRDRVDELVALAREKPDDAGNAFGEPDRTPRSTLESIAADLDEDGCAPALADEVRADVRTLG